MYNDDFLNKKLKDRKQNNAFRSLQLTSGKIDFCSNDYLGIAYDGLLIASASQQNLGSTGSRLLTGNYALLEETEQMIARFHQSSAALLFNSGYDANLGLFASVPQKGDTIIYDSLSHASIRDGIRLSFAQSFSFLHNDINDLEKKIQHASGHIFVVTESIFSMDGDSCPLYDLVQCCQKYKAHLIVDEAHATGILGQQGEGMVQQQGLQDAIFARIHTFGKACGCHGAVVLGSTLLRDYLINFARSLVYSTALPPHSVQAIKNSYALFPTMHQQRDQLHGLIKTFQATPIQYHKLVSDSPIQAVIIPGNENVKRVAAVLQQGNIDVRPILYPTVAKNKERLRIVLHSFNTAAELKQLVALLH